MKITLDVAFKHLENAAAVILSDQDCHPLTYLNLFGLTDDPENEFLYLYWNDEDGQCFNCKFSQGPNETVTVTEEGDLVFTSDEGEDIAVRLLQPMPIKHEN